MSFKQNLIVKMEIDHLAGEIIASWGTPGSGRRLDRAVVQRLMAHTQWQPRRERDLELYLSEGAGGPAEVLVLDNDLSVYRAAPEEVALRKSPTVKEMISIRNVIKILNDRDVVVSKRETSVDRIRQEAIARLDLDFTPRDIEALAQEGIAALEAQDTQAIDLILSLFGELLGYTAPPAPLQQAHRRMLGRTERRPDGSWQCGPLVIANPDDHSLGMLVEPVLSNDPDHLARIKRIAAGQEQAEVEGKAVFEHMARQVLAGLPKT